MLFRFLTSTHLAIILPYMLLRAIDSLILFVRILLLLFGK